jgi:hypothetical protein
MSYGLRGERATYAAVMDVGQRACARFSERARARWPTLDWMNPAKP